MQLELFLLFLFSDIFVAAAGALNLFIFSEFSFFLFLFVFVLVCMLVCVRVRAFWVWQVCLLGFFPCYSVFLMLLSLLIVIANVVKSNLQMWTLQEACSRGLWNEAQGHTQWLLTAPGTPLFPSV